MDTKPSFTEHRIAHGSGKIYARDYAGTGPAFVLMHGFPDNLRIYDDLVPYLVTAGRRVVTFDFLGFGASDKLPGATYSFPQQFADLEAVVEALQLTAIVPVAHDSSGPAGINFTLAHPNKVASLCILNSAYDDAFPVNWPEMITLFATSGLNPLSAAIARSPAQFGWLLEWQQTGFSDPLPPDQQARFKAVMAPIIAANFIQQPSSGPAFVQMATQFFAELTLNTRRLPELQALETPVKVIWGELDPYITTAVGKNRASLFKRATYHGVPAGHWLQSDMPERVAKELLS